jgi:hypothetical protein
MVLGYDGHGDPVVVRLFRPAGTRIVIVGGIRTARVIALRGLASGARVDVRTRRWAAWQELAAVGAVTVTPDAAPLHHWAAPHASLAAGPPVAGAAAAPTPLRPSLIILDAATSAAGRGSDSALAAAAAGHDRTSRHSEGIGQATTDLLPSENIGSATALGLATAADLRPSTRTGTGGKPAAARRRPPRRHVLEPDLPDDNPEDASATDPGTAAPAWHAAATGVGPPAKTGAPRWHAVVAVRDQLTEADAGLLAAADLVLLQILRPHEAAVAADVLRLGDAAAGWLGRIPDETVAVATTGALRWATLATTPIERSLIDTPSDIDTSQPVTSAEDWR